MNSLVHPAFHGCGNCIVFCTDDNYIYLTAVAVQSILENRNLEEKYDIVILHSGISEEHIAQYDKLFGGYDNFSVRCVNISEYVYERQFFIGNTNSSSQAAYYRLVIPWVLDDSYHRALYLDGDMIVRHDVMPLFQIDLEDKLIAAVRDYWGICFCYKPGDGRRAYRESIGLHDIDNYVISATVLFDLTKIRKEYNTESILTLCESRQWLLYDQDVLNVLFYRRIKRLSPTWGTIADFKENCFLPQALQTELAEIEDPAIFHFAGFRKPYCTDKTPFDTEFWLLASHTCYFAELLQKCNDIHRTRLIVNDLEKAVCNGERTYVQPSFPADFTQIEFAKDWVRLDEAYEEQKKRADKLQYDLDCVHNSASFRIGRAITWAPRELRGGTRGLKEHGAGYTLRRMLYHMGLWKDEEASEGPENRL